MQYFGRAVNNAGGASAMIWWQWSGVCFSLSWGCFRLHPVHFVRVKWRKREFVIAFAEIRFLGSSLSVRALNWHKSVNCTNPWSCFFYQVLCCDWSTKSPRSVNNWIFLTKVKLWRIVFFAILPNKIYLLHVAYIIRPNKLMNSRYSIAYMISSF